MPDSRDVNKRQQKSKSNNRVEFDAPTRKQLAAAAGHKCAIRGCLKPSTCATTKRNGSVGSANLGRASHIYAAAPNGPRPAPPAMALEQIGHHSNGIWTCGGCGDIVDKLECDFSPTQLLEMKRVRETAEKMAVSDPQVCAISRYISPLEFDEVFWRQLPDLDADKIRLALLEIGAREMLRICERASEGPSVPNHLPLKPLTRALKTIIESDGDDVVAVPNVVTAQPKRHRLPLRNDPIRARRSVAEIVDAWAASIPPHYWSGTGWHIHNVDVLITARHPETKMVCESGIRVVADGYGRHDNTTDDGDILHLKVTNTWNIANNLNWQLDVAFDKDGMRIASALRLSGRLLPRNFNSIERGEAFDAYEQVISKLAEGWQPIGLVAIDPGQSRIDSRLHQETFEIDLQISAFELKECLYRCSKIRLARTLEKQWGWWFVCTEDYFERSLEPTTIQAASDDLRARLGPAPYYYRGKSAVLARVGRRDIKLVARDGFITFESVVRHD